MRNYVEAKVEVISFDAEDVITTSGNEGNGTLTPIPDPSEFPTWPIPGEGE